MRDILDDIVNVVKKVGRYQLDMLGRVKNVEYKGEGERDPVTEVDKKSEEMIVSFLKDRYPEFGFITEEGSGEKGSGSYVFCVDPLDGTVNYSHGYPVFCISISLLEGSDPVLGVVYDPTRDELFVAEKGKGATMNGNAIRVSREDSLRRSLLSTGFPYSLHGRKKNNVDLFSRLVYETQGLRRCGSAALDLSYVACGRLDGFWEPGLKPWDVAAGSLIVREAGGTVTDFSGNPFSIFEDSIVATNGAIHKALLGVIIEAGYGKGNSNP